MDTSRLRQSDVHDLPGRARRHWWVVLAFGLAGLAGAGAITAQQPQTYESTTTVLVSSLDAPDTNGGTGGVRVPRLDDEAAVVRSTAVAAEAAKLLPTAVPVQTMLARVSVYVPAQGSVLVITYSAGTAAQAKAGAHAFALAYLQNRRDTANAELAGQLATVNGKILQLNAQLAALSAQLATAKPDSPARSNLDTQRTSTVSQLNALAARANTLSTTTVNAGRITADSQLPAHPVSPSAPLNLGLGALLGLGIGVAAVALRLRFGRRVRHATDLAHRAPLTVLAALPPRLLRRAVGVFPPPGAAGQVFDRLRNEIVASLGSGPEAGNVIVVTAPTSGGGASLVAANLAAALVRAGNSTVLLSAQRPEDRTEFASAGRLLGVQPEATLADVLAGRHELARALQPVPGYPGLQLVMAGAGGAGGGGANGAANGGTPSSPVAVGAKAVRGVNAATAPAASGGLLQSRALRGLTAELSRLAQYVVIEAPATEAGADAQSLAGLADVAIVAVELRRTRFSQVLDTVAQLDRVRTLVLGAVVLPRLVPRSARTAAEAPPVPPQLPRAGSRPRGSRPSPAQSAEEAARMTSRRRVGADAPTKIFKRVEAEPVAGGPDAGATVRSLGEAPTVRRLGKPGWRGDRPSVDEPPRSAPRLPNRPMRRPEPDRIVAPGYRPGPDSDSIARFGADTDPDSIEGPYRAVHSAGHDSAGLEPTPDLALRLADKPLPAAVLDLMEQMTPRPQAAPRPLQRPQPLADTPPTAPTAPTAPEPAEGPRSADEPLRRPRLDPTATGLLAALTEDGPLDGVR